LGQGRLPARSIYRKCHAPLPVGSPTRAQETNVLCFSGLSTDHKECGSVRGVSERVEPTYKELVYIVEGMKNIGGDSGAPVWNPNTGAAVGIIQGSPKAHPDWSLVVPLLPLKGVPVAKGPGALKALSLPNSPDLNLIVGG